MLRVSVGRGGLTVPVPVPVRVGAGGDCTTTLDVPDADTTTSSVGAGLSDLEVHPSVLVVGMHGHTLVDEPSCSPLLHLVLAVPWRHGPFDLLVRAYERGGEDDDEEEECEVAVFGGESHGTDRG